MKWHGSNVIAKTHTLKSPVHESRTAATNENQETHRVMDPADTVKLSVTERYNHSTSCSSAYMQQKSAFLQSRSHFI